MKFSEYDLVEILEDQQSGLVVALHTQPERYDIEILGVNGAPSRFVTLPPEALRLVRRSGMGSGIRRAPLRKAQKGEAVLAVLFCWKLAKLMFRGRPGRERISREQDACLRDYRAQGGSLTSWQEAERWSLYCTFSDSEQLERGVEQLSAFFRWVQHGPQGQRPWVGRYTFQPKELPWEEVRLEQRPGDSVARILERCAEVFREYSAFYRIPCAGCTQEELDMWSRERWDWETMPRCPQAWQGEEKVPGPLLAGIGLCRGTVSYGGVYELLRRLDLPVRGTPERFIAIGADGVEYGFSYQFFRTVPYGPGKSKRVWYFLRGGEPVEWRSKISWWERGPTLPIREGQNIPRDETHFTWAVVLCELTGLRFQ